MTTDHHDSITVLNNLLRGELSAVETYTQAIDRFRREAVAPILEGMRGDHLDSASRLREAVAGLGGEPSESSGAWGLFVKSIEGTAKLFGENSALAALLQGEQVGQISYEQALEQNGLQAPQKDLIQVSLLPRQNRHVSTLRGLTATR